MIKQFGNMMQMAFVVENFDDSIKFWTKKMNVGPFFKLEHLRVRDVYYKDKDVDIDFSVAIAYSGGMQIELVNQHCDTPSIYNEYVNNEKGPLHHLCTLTTDIENDIRILESQGYINLQGGKTEDDGKFAYLDTKEREGPMIEIAQLSDASLRLFAMMKEASKNWDREAPVMNLGDLKS
jgi:methylmalonyl-CoA/ethylmalonyl-CoA epimerase